MLKKLIKHEWKDTWAVGTTCSIIVLVLAIIGMFVLREDIWRESANRSETAESFTAITMMLYFMMFVWGLIAAAFVVRYYFFWRYYKNLFTDHGYLMNTLPVKSTDLINAKLFVAVIWQYIISIIIGLAIFVLIMGMVVGISPYSWSEFWQDFAELWREINWSEFGEYVPFLICMFLCMLLAPIGSVLLMYTAVGIGQMVKKYKFLVSVLILIGLLIAKQAIASYASLPFSLAMNEWDITTTMVNIGSFIAVLVLSGAIIGLYFLNKYFLEQKLNLE
ncbi:MAG: hypothetical protein HDR00_08425 [Lachnospiraceae bacterium]|nr:hypothetical protein [Lachnospiraceae bacterium]